MTNIEKEKLNLLFQTIILERAKYKSILGGKADCVHHWKQGRNYATLWHLPMGIPLTVEQHNDIHLLNSKGIKYIEYIKKLKGKEWVNEVELRKWKISRNVKYKNVLKYFNGIIEDYI